MAIDTSRDLDPFALGADLLIIALQQTWLQQTPSYLIERQGFCPAARVRQSGIDC
jgi:hypothetical protein